MSADLAPALCGSSRAAARAHGQEPVADQLRQDLGVGEWGWWPTVGMIDPSALGRAGLELVEVAARDDPVLVALEQEDLGRDLRQDRPEVETGQQVDAMRQRPDRRQAVLLEVKVPAVVEERGELGLAVVGQDRAVATAAAPTVPGTVGPAASAQRSAGENVRWANAPCTAALGNRRGSRCSALSVTVEPNESPTRNTRPMFRWSISPKRSSTRWSWVIRRQAGAVVRVLAGIVVEDRPEALGEPVEQQRVDAIGRGDARDQDQRRSLPEDAVGHPVARAVPAPDLGRRVVAQRPRRGNRRGPGRGARGAARTEPGSDRSAPSSVMAVAIWTWASKAGVAGAGSEAWNAMLAKLTQQVRRSSRA